MSRRLLLLVLIALVLWAAPASAATWTHAVTTSNTTGGTSLVSGAFTPAASDLLVVAVSAAVTVAAGTVTDSQALGFTKITSGVFDASASTTYIFVANALAAAASMTVTFDCTGDSANGISIFVARVSGMTKTGATAVLQSAKQENQAASTTPAPVFGAAVQTGNPTLGLIGNNSNPAALTPPTSWTEQADVGYATPASGAEYVTRDSGFTGTTVTWGSTSATVFGSIVVELDASATGTAKQLLLLGIGDE